MEYTHIVLTYPSQNTEVMFRASDGVMIAERQNNALNFGEDPNAAASDPKRKQSRIFLETEEKLFANGEEHKWNFNASRYMRERVPGFVDDEYLTKPILIDERCQEGSVILAPDSLDLRVNGGGMPAVSLNKIGRKVQ